jgi:Tol biopolymer transport system component
MKWLLRAVTVLCAVAGSAATAQAQYFGQNKVQYEKFDFKVLNTEHFDIYYYPEEREAVQIAARMAERWYHRLSRVLKHELSSRQPLILYAAHPHFQQTNVLGGEIGEGTGGVTESGKRRIILPFAGGLAETDHVLGHELVHAFQYDMAMPPGSDAQRSAMGALPLWFVEGMAEYLSLGPVDAHTSMWVRDASAREKMPTIDKLDDPEFFPYRYGHAFWAYVASRWGDEAVGDMFHGASRVGSIEDTMEAVLNIDKKQFTADWHEATRIAYAPYVETTRPPTAFGRAVVNRELSGGEMNVSPSLSPDGKRLVFLSERSMFAIEMYVADVETGKVTRRLVKTTGNPHFESLQFIESAGDWAPDNRRFVFSALAKGQPVLSIVDVDNGRNEAEYEIADVDQIFNPAWSTDGRRIAFSALTGGVLDLYVFDIESRAVTRLTNDAYADMDPEWSPNGTELAWVTDRFSSRPDVLAFGDYRIGLMTVATREARLLGGFENTRNTNPEFLSDGRSLLFVATPDGIANVYRLDLQTGAIESVTDVLSGVSGITPLTPALSAATQTTRYVFTVFEDNKYSIYTADRPVPVSPTPEPLEGRTAAILPPFNRKPGPVAQYLAAPADGLPPPMTFDEQEYSPKLSLDGAVQPTVAAGVDRFGGYAGGGLALFFSDTLGNHELITAIQATSRFDEFGGAVAYFNRTHRWNWGIIGEQTPYVTGGYGQFFDTLNGQLVIADVEERIIQINRGVTGLLQYPFSRAQRVEVSGGFRNISFSGRRDTRYFSPFTGQQVAEERVDLPTPDGLNLGEASTALVYDTSTFGATSPIVGQRYRLEYTQMAGSLLLSGVTADYRRYFMPFRPFTFAFRGMHYGRYGRDSEDTRLSPLFIGYPGLVRGYDVNSFDASECIPTATDACPAFNDLIGSKMALGSAEVRFPLVGVFNRSTFYGPLPIEIALFGDAGVAWDRETEPRFLGGDKPWVRSLGAAVRFNAFGYFVGEIDYVKPLDRPERGWSWQFNLIPGF